MLVKIIKEIFKIHPASNIKKSSLLLIFIFCQGCIIQHKEIVENKIVEEFDEYLVLSESVNAPAGYRINMEFRARIIQPLLVIDNISPPTAEPPFQ